MSSEANYICKKCLEVGSFGSVANDFTDRNSEDSDDSDAERREALGEKATDIGKDFAVLIRADIKELRSEKNAAVRTFENLTEHDAIQWLSRRPEPLVHLLATMCDIDLNTASEKQMISLAKTIEQLYHCINSRLILPYHFIENLLCYSFTNCKTFINLASSHSPDGGYAFIKNWLKEQSKSELKCPSGIVKSVFDNNQKIGRTYVISETNTVPTSITTSHIWLVLDAERKMHEMAQFKRSNWIAKPNKEEKTKAVLEKLTDEAPNLRKSRDIFLTKCIKVVKNQHVSNEFEQVDQILRARNEANNQKRCTVCHCESDITYRVCRNCGNKVVKEASEELSFIPSNNINPYYSFDEFAAKSPYVSCHVGDSDLIDPNGYKNIIQVLLNIGSRTGIKQYQTIR